MFRSLAFLPFAAFLLLASGAYASSMKVELRVEEPSTQAPAPQPVPVAPPKPKTEVPFLCVGEPLKVEVVPSFGHVSRDMTLRSVDLSTPKAWGTAMVAHLGAQIKLSQQTAYKIEMDKSAACVLQVETVVLFKLDPKIRSKNQYEPDSCEYKQVEAHEQRHILAAKEFMKQSVPLLKEYLITAMDGLTSFSTSRDDRVAAQLYLEQTMNNRLEEYERYMNSEFIRTQTVGLDTPEQMTQMFAQCPGWKAPEIHSPDAK